LHVHDLADYVTAESRSCGKGAAAYVSGKLNLDAPYFNMAAGKNILYVVPHRVRLANLDTHLTIKFRVNQPLQNQVLTFTFNGQVIKKIVKPIIIPSEMQKVRLPKELFDRQDGELIVSSEDR
jgi:hypothetical protein